MKRSPAEVSNFGKTPGGLAAAVIAGGRSSRMGTDKAFVPWQGRRLIDHQLELLRRLGPSEIVVSGRSGVDYGLEGVAVVRDAVPDRGPLGGIVAVIGATGAPLVLVLAVDLPGMEESFLSRLLERSGPGLGAVARSPEGWEPLAAVYSREILPFAKARLDQGRLALQSLVDEAVERGLMRPIELAPGEARLFTNVNTTGDLRAFAVDSG